MKKTTPSPVIVLACGLLLSCAGCDDGKPQQGAKPAGQEAPMVKASEQPAAPIELHDAGAPGDAQKGGATYAKFCVACHQMDGSGMNGMLAADLRKDPARLAKPDSVLLRSIAEGVKGAKLVMPPQKGLLSEQEIKDVLAYVRREFGAKK